MSAPTNTSQGAAIVISALPFSASVNQADWTLAGGVPLWWKYTAQSGDVAAGLRITATSAASVAPVLDVLTSPPTVITEAGTDGSGNSKPAQTGLVAGTTYYFTASIIGSLGGSGTVSFTLVQPPQITTAIGSLVIPDETPGFPAMLIDTSTGQVTWVAAFPAGEFAGHLADGTILTNVKSGSSTVSTLALYDALLTFLSNVAVPDGSTAENAISGTRTGTPLFVVASVGGTVAVKNIYVLNASGGIVATWPLPADGSGQYSLQTLAVSPNGAFAYWVDQQNGTGIHRMNLSTGADTVLVAGAGGFSNIKEIITLADGSIVADYSFFGITDTIRRYSSAGVQQGTDYTVDAAYFFDHMAPGADDPTSIVVWLQDQAGPTVCRYLFLNVADWSDNKPPFDLVIFQNGAARQATLQDFGPSNSCPIFLTTTTFTPPVTTGAIIVTKVVTPVSAGTFAFTAGGGLSPGSFTLANGQSETFDPVTAGSGYSIVETVPSGWTVTYDVSNGSPHDNLTVGSGETVTVTVINQPPSSLVGVTIDCETQVVTITGTGFRAGASITVFDGNGVSVPFTLLTFTSTQITLALAYSGPGTYRVSVVNPS